MQVTEVMTFDEYWDAFPKKKPNESYFTGQDSKKCIKSSCNKIINKSKNDYDEILVDMNNDDFRNCGDNIYHIDPQTKEFMQSYSFHRSKHDKIRNENTYTADLKGKYVLLSDNYVYYGNNAESIDYQQNNPQDRNAKNMRNVDMLLHNSKRQKWFYSNRIEDKQVIDIITQMIDKNLPPDGKSPIVLARPTHSHEDFNWEDE
jgi:hypothetical protein